jgi:hypothetical protein
LKASPGLAAPEETGPWSASYAEAARARRRGMRWLALTILAIPALYWLARLLMVR